MAYIQETVSFLTEMFIVSPINWLTDSKKSIDLQEVTQRNRPDPEEIAMEMTSMSSNDPPARREPVEMPPRREPMEMKTEPQSEPYGRKMEREEMMEDMEEEENADDLD
ncbi:hypothetical protein DPMN_154746 [Dreissena polymorpha]|uniref:Uncharacterized protein n=2 Tax=Dreissena polymorpha TaxID=45954 RepID=A0A9D4FQJ5_DREPO|nr:hypothetical protein DPMN_154746 [Dreissena polymorpha]